MKPVDSKDPREVNSLLHTLRGEQFRHSQNVKQSRTHLAAFRDHSRPTLSSRLTRLEYGSSADAGSSILQSPPVSYSGPAPPKSWRPATERDAQENVQWRARALKLVASYMGNFMDTPHVPSLALLCLQMIFALCTNSNEFREGIVPYIPYHLRRDAIRYCAIHSPLPNWKLDALFNPQGNADGEILIMGPTATLPENHFIKGKPVSEEDDDSAAKPITPADRDWELEDSSDEPLISLILVSTRLPTSTMFSFPPTLTRLALINLSTSVPIHRLPKLCPLIILLDLSYNDWLKDPKSEGIESVEKTPWTRWKNLELLGMRECYVSDDLIRKVNVGRWDDVNVVKN